MRERVSTYILTAALLGVAVYLRSPMTAIVTVGLWAVQAAEAVMTRRTRDADITEIMQTLQAHRAKMDLLTRDVGNVAERAKTILGETF